MDILFFIVMGLVAYVVVQIAQKKPILPDRIKFWKNNETTMAAKKGLEEKFTSKSKKKDEEAYIEKEPNLFEELIDDLEDVKHNMMLFKNQRYVMMAEVTPCNYFLRSQAEQEVIDSAFEAWTATLNYPCTIYLQNRFIDLSEPIDEMKKNMEVQRDLPRNALQYGKSVLNDLIQWQNSQPRYETKHYLLFSYELKKNNLNLAEGESFQEAAAEKAFNELMRRMSNAQTQLHGGNFVVQPLATDGIIEVLYHTFNRRKALKNKFKNVKEREQMSLYITADQTDTRIELTKEKIAENKSA
ncbi:hypothetical protein [Bacillus sp. AR18-7]|uniref:hypothetical protein n=1 Tax=Bacillus sp. AR18-7 TaxID=2217821 RepID=UPI0021081AB2|nr:hypothetical protein [Bacillus sp. AR18-7]